MSHEGNDKIIDQLIDEMNSDVIYEVTITSERIEVLQLIKQILRTTPTLLNLHKREHEYEIGPVIEKQVTVSELLEEKFDA